MKQGTARDLTRHKRDWIHVDDVCTAIEKLIYSDYTGTVDVGTGVTTSVLELANALIGENELPIQEWTPNEPDILKANPVVLREMGWVPTPFLDKIQSKCYTK
jgi:nucleoside-diphosphate-sugar epimerase